MSSSSRNKVYEGRTKVLYSDNSDSNSNKLIQYFTDLLPVSSDKSVEISGKGTINNSISSYIMNKMSLLGISNHLIRQLNMREQLIHSLEILPLKVHLTNISYGKYVEQFEIEEGSVFSDPQIEFSLKSDQTSRSVNEYQILSLNIISVDELKLLMRQAIKINDFLSGFFAAANLRLVSCQLEFGMNYADDNIFLADEISPDNCIIWDISTNQSFSYEYVSQEPAKTLECYNEVLKRIRLKS